MMLQFLMDFFGVEHLPNLILAIAAVIGGCILLFNYGRKVLEGIRKQKTKWNNVHDSLVGTGPILDPETGEELKPATQSLAHRVSTLEDSLATIANAIDSLSRVEQSLARLQENAELEHKELWAAIEEISS